MDWLVALSIAFFSFLVPIGIYTSRLVVRQNRAQTLETLGKTLEEQSGTTKLPYWFEYARYHYSNQKQCLRTKNRSGKFSLIFAVGVYIVISFLGFFSALSIHLDDPMVLDMHRDHIMDNVLLSGIELPPFTVPANQVGTTAITAPANQAGTTAATAPANRGQTVGTPESSEPIRYRLQTLSVSSAAFIGAYLWTLIYLGRRVTNDDLTAYSFLRSTFQIALACFVAIALRHIYDMLPAMNLGSQAKPNDGIGNWFLALCFLVGFYPLLGMNYLQERFPALQLKSRDPLAGKLSREIGIELIDGIDSFQKFRLEEFEIQDVQAMATVNPILLFVSSPYSLFQVLDWVNQAQLITLVEMEKIIELRKIGVRTITELAAISTQPEGKKLIGKILFPAVDNPTSLTDAFIFSISQQIRFKRLKEVEEFVHASPRTVCCLC